MLDDFRKFGWESEQLPAEGKAMLFGAVGEEAKMAYAHEAFGENME